MPAEEGMKAGDILTADGKTVNTQEILNQLRQGKLPQSLSDDKASSPAASIKHTENSSKREVKSDN